MYNSQLTKSKDFFKEYMYYLEQVLFEGDIGKNILAIYTKKFESAAMISIPIYLATAPSHTLTFIPKNCVCPF